MLQGEYSTNGSSGLWMMTLMDTFAALRTFGKRLANFSTTRPSHWGWAFNFLVYTCCCRRPPTLVHTLDGSCNELLHDLVGASIAVLIHKTSKVEQVNCRPAYTQAHSTHTHWHTTHTQHTTHCITCAVHGRQRSGERWGTLACNLHRHAVALQCQQPCSASQWPSTWPWTP